MMIHGLEVDVKTEEPSSRDENRVEPADKWLEQLRDDYRKLYDLFKAQGERIDARFDQLEAEMRTGFANLQAAITALMPRARRTRGRRRR